MDDSGGNIKQRKENQNYISLRSSRLSFIMYYVQIQSCHNLAILKCFRND